MMSTDGSIHNLNKDMWDVDDMTMAVAAKEIKRNSKNKSFNVFVVDHPITGKSEFSSLLNSIKTNQNNIPDGARFQIAVKTVDHWSMIDVERTTQGFNFFVLDDSNDLAKIQIVDALKIKFYNNSKIWQYDHPIKDNTKPYTHTNLKYLQNDEHSCSRFVLDHIFHLSQIDVFKKLNLAKCQKNSQGIYVVNQNNLPTKMASIYRNVQSYTLLSSLPQRLRSFVFNKKGQTVETAARSGEKQQEFVATNGQKVQSKINVSVENKKQSFITSVQDAAEKMPDLLREKVKKTRSYATYFNDKINCEALKNRDVTIKIRQPFSFNLFKIFKSRSSTNSSVQENTNNQQPSINKKQKTP